MMNPVPWLQMTNMISYQGLVRTFPSAIGTESLRYDLLPGLHEMFRSIADKIVFEGVETQEQVNYLKTFWPQSYAQGWYYSRALPLEEARKLTIRELN